VKTWEDEIRELNGKIVCREAEWVNNSESLKNDITKSYGIGFEAVVEQACVIHPDIDFSDVNPCYAVVDGKLVKDV